MLVVHLVRKEPGIDLERKWNPAGEGQFKTLQSRKRQEWRWIFWMGGQDMRNELVLAETCIITCYTSRAPVIWSSADISNPGSQIGLEKKRRMGLVL